MQHKSITVDAKMIATSSFNEGMFKEGLTGSNVITIDLLSDNELTSKFKSVLFASLLNIINKLDQLVAEKIILLDRNDQYIFPIIKSLYHKHKVDLNASQCINGISETLRGANRGIFRNYAYLCSFSPGRSYGIVGDTISCLLDLLPNLDKIKSFREKLLNEEKGNMNMHMNHFK